MKKDYIFVAQVLKQPESKEIKIGREMIHIGKPFITEEGDRSVFLTDEDYPPAAWKDDLSPVIDRIFAADALIIGSPVYLGDITSQVHGLIERLHFCALSYDDYSNYFTGRVNVGIILTMNAPKAFYDAAYKKKAEEIAQSFKGLNGTVEIYPCCDTLQVADYSKYNMAGFDEEHKKEMREKQFPEDLANAYQLGVRLSGGMPNSK